MITIVETAAFMKKAEKLIKEAERKDLVDHVAMHYRNGDVIAGTGGVRKIRYARKGQGKRGGYRVIYYYYDKNNPLFLFSIYGKNEKDNITDSEKQAYYKGIQVLKKELKQ